MQSQSSAVLTYLCNFLSGPAVIVPGEAPRREGPMGKRYEGKVGDSRAKIDEEGDRIDALYNFRGGDDKDHLVSNDGINASYLREDGEVIVDDLQP